MGQAKIRRAAGQGFSEERMVRLSRITLSVAEFLEQAGPSLWGYTVGACEGSTALLHAVMHRHGVESRIVCGYAAWRIGRDAGAVVTHHPDATTIAAPQLLNANGQYFLGYFWVESDGIVCDANTHSLAEHLQALERCDGIHAEVLWNRPAVVIAKSRCRPLRSVIQGYEWACYYEEQAHLLPEVRRIYARLDEYRDLADKVLPVLASPDLMRMDELLEGAA